jgi:hypothetical protein
MVLLDYSCLLPGLELRGGEAWATRDPWRASSFLRVQVRLLLELTSGLSFQCFCLEVRTMDAYMYMHGVPVRWTNDRLWWDSRREELINRQQH